MEGEGEGEEGGGEVEAAEQMCTYLLRRGTTRATRSY